MRCLFDDFKTIYIEVVFMSNRVLNIPENELSQQEKDILSSLSQRKQLGHWLVTAIKEHIQRVNPNMNTITEKYITITNPEGIDNYIKDILSDNSVPENKKSPYMINLLRETLTKYTENFTKTVIINKETGTISIE